MIAKKVKRKPENDNYRALAIYIDGGDQKENEKVLERWYTGGSADNYNLGMIEVEATQEINKRSNKEKTYHLVLSFRPEDEAKLTPEAFQNMEMEIAKALGFEEHQRHCGVHQNTNNMHMHIAYNMIHPETFNRHEMKGDFYALSQACRELEQKYGLIIDNGIEKGEEKRITNAKALSVEVVTGQQSFYSYAKEKKIEITQQIKNADTWEKVHEIFSSYGMELKPHANGLILKDINNKKSAHIKASDLDRSLSKNQLEKRFGSYQTPEQKYLVQETYEAKPLQKGMEQDHKKELFQEFQASIEKRKKTLEEIKQTELNAKEKILEFWKNKRLEIDKNINLSFSEKNKLKAIIKVNELKELKPLKTKFNKERESLRQEVPFVNWTEFLQVKARDGDELALSILRSKKIEVAPEKENTENIWEKQRHIKEFWQQTQAELRANQQLTFKDKKSLLSVTKMRQLDELADLDKGKENIFKAFKYEVDSEGNVLFQLADGGFVRDTGKEILFNMDNKKAKQVAEALATAKFGKNIILDGNKIIADFQKKEIIKTVIVEKKQGLVR